VIRGCCPYSSERSGTSSQRIAAKRCCGA
jgi:hypothetical protein